MMHQTQTPTSWQLPLLPQMQQPAYEPEMTIQERFEAFHAANPHVYRLLRSLALEMRNIGIHRSGVKFLVERLRWDYLVQTRGREKFKLSNDFTSRYARLLMAQEPALEGFFVTKELRSA